MTPEQFLREKYKLVDFTNLNLNAHSWLEIMKEYSESENEEWEKSFDLYHSAVMRGTELFRKNHPNYPALSLPDTAKMIEFLCNQIEYSEQFRTPSPDVEAMASICPDCRCFNKGSGEEIIKCWNCGNSYRQNPQSSQPQDATQGQDWVEKLIELEKDKWGSNYYYHGTSYQATNWIHENIVSPLQSELSTLRSQLAEKDEEIKRLRVQLRYSKDIIKTKGGKP